MPGKSRREPLFSVTRKDLDVQFMRAGGPGGQHQNKTSSACRIAHTASGAIGESREQRSQVQNKKLALQRLAASARFKTWVRMQAAAILAGYHSIEEKVEKALAPANLKIEVLNVYTCDGCGRKTQPLHLQPADWTSLPLGESDQHFCPSCMRAGRYI